MRAQRKRESVIRHNTKTRCAALLAFTRLLLKQTSHGDVASVIETVAVAIEVVDIVVIEIVAIESIALPTPTPSFGNYERRSTVGISARLTPPVCSPSTTTSELLTSWRGARTRSAKPEHQHGAGENRCCAYAGRFARSNRTKSKSENKKQTTPGRRTLAEAQTTNKHTPVSKSSILSHRLRRNQPVTRTQQLARGFKRSGNQITRAVSGATMMAMIEHEIVGECSSILIRNRIRACSSMRETSSDPNALSVRIKLGAL